MDSLKNKINLLIQSVQGDPSRSYKHRLTSKEWLLVQVMMVHEGPYKGILYCSALTGAVLTVDQVDEDHYMLIGSPLETETGSINNPLLPGC